MFGITNSGCFVAGIIIGFILALILGIACVFYFNPEIKSATISKVESVWGTVKTNVDDSIDAVKKAPSAEPHIPQGPAAAKQPNGRKTGTPAPAPASRPRIEVKIGI